jgi:uncharacterized membrane-anchored protein YitT (DUF2179 family)
MITMRQRLSQFNARRILQNYLLLTVGVLLLAVNLNLFLAPANIAPGGVSGTAIIINHLTGWPIGLTMLVLNIPLIGLGFRYLGRFRFLMGTLYAVLLYSFGVDILAQWLPAGGLTDDLLLSALYGGVVGGIGSGLVFRGGGTTAGTGILGRVLQLRTGIPVSQIYLATDGAVVRMVFIVTDRPEAVADAVFHEVHLGVTAWPAEGMFTETEHAVLFCTVSRPHERALRRVVLEADPHAFVVVGHGHQASGGVFGQPRHTPRKGFWKRKNTKTGRDA